MKKLIAGIFLLGCLCACGGGQKKAEAIEVAVEEVNEPVIEEKPVKEKPVKEKPAKPVKAVENDETQFLPKEEKKVAKSGGFMSKLNALPPGAVIGGAAAILAVLVAIMTLQKDIKQNNRIRYRILLPILKTARKWIPPSWSWATTPPRPVCTR